MISNFTKTRMILSAAVMALPLIGMAGVMPANATTIAETVTALNMRAGPATTYPVVTTLPAYAGVTLYGCTADTTWCDVSWGADRGWVAAGYITIAYNGGYTVVTPRVAPAAGIAVVTYSAAYWNAYYVGRPWYNQWNAYHPGEQPVRYGNHGCKGEFCGGYAGQSGPNGAVGVAGGTSPNGGAVGAAGVIGPDGNGIGVVGGKGPNGNAGGGVVVCGPDNCGHGGGRVVTNGEGNGMHQTFSGTNPRPLMKPGVDAGGGKRLEKGRIGKIANGGLGGGKNSGGGFRKR